MMLSKLMNESQGKWFLPIILAILIIGIGAKLIFGFFILRFFVGTASAIFLIWIAFMILKSIKKRTEQQSRKIDAFDEIEKRIINAKEFPWYLMIGSSGCGKTTLLGNSDIGFSYIDSPKREPNNQGIEVTRNCDLFYTRESFALDITEHDKSRIVIIDTSGRYMTENMNASIREEWLSILSYLKKHPNNPIKGLILAINIDSLLNDQDKITEQATTLREQIQEIINVLGFKFPIYLVFTKCDSIYGFTQFSNILGKDKSPNIFGCTLGNEHQEDAETAFRDMCKNLQESLNINLLSNLSSASDEERKSAYAFPLEFGFAYQILAPFVATLFPAISKDRPIFRGFYFTSAKQENPFIDFVFSKVAEPFNLAMNIPSTSTIEQNSSKSYFIKDVFNKVIFPDLALSSPTNEAEKKEIKKLAMICGIIVLVFLFLFAIPTITYFRNRNLIENVSYSVKSQSFETLRMPIAGLESWLSFPWNAYCNGVAEKARYFYLANKYGDSTDYQYKLSRTVTIPVNVLKVDKGKKYPVARAEVIATIEGKQYKQKTDRNGTTVFKVKVNDGRISVDISAAKNEPGYANLPKEICEIKLGERTKNPILLIFSKFIVKVHCTDQNGGDLKGVPISITIDGLTPEGYSNKFTNEKGNAIIEFDAQEGSNVLIYYDESTTNSKGEADEVDIMQNKFEYSIEKQLHRKIVKRDIVKNEPSDNSDGEIDVPSPGKLPQIKSIKVINESGNPVNDPEIWVSINDDINPFNSTDEMEFVSDGTSYKFVKINLIADRGGIFNLPNLPKEAMDHQILICHPDYWTQNIGWKQITKWIRMISVGKKHPSTIFDNAQIDGSNYYYELAQNEHKKGKSRLNKAIEYYKKSIGLMPTKRAYTDLGWAYQELGNIKEAEKQLNRALMINISYIETKQDQDHLKALPDALK